MIIFIKSFNRPYYLDRCIRSILLNVAAPGLKIIVLDDGTQPRYLARIQEKFPDVVIKTSPFYEEKARKIESFLKDGTPIGKLEIPTEFWLSSIKQNDEDYFILLEDDMWFKEPLDLSAVLALMYVQNMCLLKFFHFGNKRLISGALRPVSDQISTIEPKLLFENPLLFKNIILRNPLKVLSVLRRLGMYNPMAKIDYYTIYNVAGAIFSRDYYEYLWKGFTGLVDEDAQLVKAVEYYHRNKHQLKYGVYNTDVLTTSFSSSATSMFPDSPFNVFKYNDLLNKAWYKEQFNVMAGYPGDIAGHEIINILQKENDLTASPEEWHKWADRFKAHYREVGHIID